MLFSHTDLHPKVTRNFLWNIAGLGLPIVAAIAAIPTLIQVLGNTRFSFLTLAWLIIGYFSLFDFGIGKASTRLLAERLSKCRKDPEIPKLVRTSLIALLAMGLVATLVAWSLCPWIVKDVLDIPLEYTNEFLLSSYLLAGSLPFVIVKTGLVGTLEANDRFDIINLIRIPLGISNFLIPLLIVKTQNNLVFVVGSLVIARLVAFSCYGFFCNRVTPGLLKEFRLSRGAMSSLFRFGSMMTISNILHPLMMYLDRFFVVATTKIASVAYYTTSFEIVIRIGIISHSLSRVLFPLFAATFKENKEECVSLFLNGLLLLFLILFPITLVITTLAYELLNLWLGIDFAERSTPILQFLVVGMFFSGQTQIPVALIHSAGKPSITAKLHLIEFPCYFILLWISLNHFGILGAAIAFLLRSMIDGFITFIFAFRLLNSYINKLILLVPTVSLVLFYIGTSIDILELKIIFVSVQIVPICIYTWFKYREIYPVPLD